MVKLRDAEVLLKGGVYKFLEGQPVHSRFLHISIFRDELSLLTVVFNCFRQWNLLLKIIVVEGDILYTSKDSSY